MTELPSAAERALALSLLGQGKRQECLAETFALMAADLERRGRFARARQIRDMARHYRVRSIESRARALAFGVDEATR